MTDPLAANTRATLRGRLSGTDLRRRGPDELPPHLFQAVLDGKMTAREARAEMKATREQRQEANDMIRKAVPPSGVAMAGTTEADLNDALRRASGRELDPETGRWDHHRGQAGPPRDPETGRFTSSEGQPGEGGAGQKGGGAGPEPA